MVIHNINTKTFTKLLEIYLLLTLHTVVFTLLRATCGHSSTFISGGKYGFSIILVWLSPSDLWLYLRECPFYPWLLMAYKKITSPTKCPSPNSFSELFGCRLGLVISGPCVCVRVGVCVRVLWPRLRGASRSS